MPRKFIKRLLPEHHQVRDHRRLRFLGTLLHDPYLFHLTRRSVAGSFFIGLFIAFVPIPGQMAVAALAAILVRVNLPLAVALVWITNPLTMGPIFFFSYKVGTWLLDAPVHESLAELSYLQWLGVEIRSAWRPLLLGSFVCGLISGLVGFAVVRIAWRMHVISRWRRRRAQREGRRRSAAR